MTREEALQILDTIPTISEQVDALEMAIQALSQVSEIEENIIKYMKKYPNHVGNTDFWEGFYACRNVVLQLDDEEYAPKEQEPCDDAEQIDYHDSDASQIALDAIKNGTPIPDNATNGDVIKAMFPNLEIKHTDIDEYTNKPRYVKLIVGNTIITRMSADRWNAPYQKGGK